MAHNRPSRAAFFRLLADSIHMQPPGWRNEGEQHLVDCDAAPRECEAGSWRSGFPLGNNPVHASLTRRVFKPRLMPSTRRVREGSVTPSLTRRVCKSCLMPSLTRRVCKPRPPLTRRIREGSVTPSLTPLLGGRDVPSME